MKRVPLIYWLPVILYYGFITFLSGSLPDFPSAYASSARLDKFFHFIEYFFFGLVLARDLFWQKTLLGERRGWFPAFCAFMATLIFFDEFHQFFVPTRYMDFYDGLADAVGALLGMSTYVYAVRGRRPDTAAITYLRERDRRRFSPFIVAICFFIIVSVGVLRLKMPLARRLPIAFAMSDLIEWAVLGFFSYRSVWLLLRREGHMNPGGWLLTVLAGIFLAVEYALIFEYFRSNEVPTERLFHFGGYFASGSLLGAGRTAVRLMNERVANDPAYGRETVQRLYYFLPPFILWLVICFFSAAEPRDIARRVVERREFERIAYFFLFFSFAIAALRAVAWEAWWNEAGRRLKLWGGAATSLIASVGIAEGIRHFAGERGGNALQTALNAAAVLLACAVYAAGWRWVRRGKGRSAARAR